MRGLQHTEGIIPSMIPLRLRVSGFLSYREPVELDFTSFDLACISGPNGAGKSTLLDAMTWALFGQARKRDESLINLQSTAAEVALTFGYEGAIYRVQRSIARGKSSTLEFQVEQGRSGNRAELTDGVSPVWLPLTERTLRETQARIEGILRLDYETFINASFFLQGKADQFAQQTPSRRKEVLGSILGLESWEDYRSWTADGRRRLEGELSAIEGRRAEIAAELAEEPARKERLASLEADFQRLDQTRRSQEAAVESIRKAVAALEQQRKTVEILASTLERSRAQMASLSSRFEEREAVRRAAAELTGRADEVRSRYSSWQEARLALQKWETTASAFHEQDQLRRPFLEAIAAEKARLEQELNSLMVEQQEIEDQTASAADLTRRLEALRASAAEMEARAAERERLRVELATALQSQIRMRAENEALRPEMDTLRTRIDTLNAAEGGNCPLCGQPLSARHRKVTLQALQAEGKERGDRYRANKSAVEDLSVRIGNLEQQVAAFAGVEEERLAQAAAAAQLGERVESLRAVVQLWQSTGNGRLAEVRRLLEAGEYAAEARRKLAAMDRKLAKLGYDAGAHDAARQRESGLRSVEAEHRSLEAAVAALEPLEDEIRNLKPRLAALGSDLASQQADLVRARSTLEAAAQATVGLEAAEAALLEFKEKQSTLNRELGAARQKVAVLDDLRARDAEYETARQDLGLRIGRHRVLERAFGRDGVPALLIEQALPEIESKANELLDRLSDGRMSVRFITQAEYKDRKREDLRETLDIQISDGAGVRDYELYSGGEAFRINFAVRLALSEVLAARKGARLQTLVIDEGFGSQDDQGRQRLIEAINLVKNDFALVLVITHLDQLKDAFPTRIEIEKTEAGSRARVI